MDLRRSAPRRTEAELTPADYRALADLRYQVRRFLRFSEQAARESGLEPRQHQFMLALKGMPKGINARIGDLAERLQIQHHSAVELANRLASQDYVRRRRGTLDRREVLLSLTSKGEHVLRRLSLQHHAELGTMGPELARALKSVIRFGDKTRRNGRESLKKTRRKP